MVDIPVGVDARAIKLFAYLATEPEIRIAEFIDNSIASYLLHIKKKNFPKTFKLKIKIICKTKKISIEDNAGGIHDNDLGRAFITAAPPANTKSLNEFGVGMKIAAKYFTDKMTIMTKAIGESKRKEIIIDYSKIENMPHGVMPTIQPKEISTPRNKSSFTIITLKEIREDKVLSNKVQKKIRAKLESRYRKFFDDGSVTILFNDDRLIYKKPKVRVRERFESLKQYYKDKKNKPKPIRWEKKFNFYFGKNNLKASGEISILETSSPKKAGFYFFRKNVCIQEALHPEEIFGNSTSDQRYKSLTGEIVFDPRINVASDKSKIDFSNEEEDDFYDKLLKFLKDKDFPLYYESDRAQKSYEAIWNDIKEQDDFKKNRKKQADDVSEFGSPRKIPLQKIKAKTIEPSIPTIYKPEDSTNIVPFNYNGITYNFTIETYGKDNLNQYKFIHYEKIKSNNSQKDFKIKINLSAELIKDYFSTNLKTITGIKLFSVFLVQSAIFTIETEKIPESKFKSFFENLNIIMKDSPPDIK